MARRRVALRIAKVVVFVAALIPLGVLAFKVSQGTLRPDPVKRLTHTTGLTTLILLLITLSISPLRRLTGFDDLVGFRRMIGLFAFSYAVIHFMIFVVFDHFFSLPAIAEDVIERPYVTVGFTALVLLVPLAITSTKGWIRRLGGRRWARLHQLVYVASALGVLHFLWLVKLDTREPIVYGLILVALLATRVGWNRKRRARQRIGS